MIVIAVMLLIAAGAMGQTPPVRISPEEAERRILKQPPPIYPPLADMARIQGNVIIHARISETGAATAQSVVRGHPMLTKAALDAVDRWKYRPVEVNGAPRAAMTIVIVRFGNPANHDAEDYAEVRFLHNFLTLVESTEGALNTGDYSRAEQHLQQAQGLFAGDDATGHRAQQARLWSLTGRLRRAQRKLDEAEQCYKQALATYQSDYFKESPLLGFALADIGNLYLEEKRVDLARDNLTKALAIHRKNFKNVGKGVPESREQYGKAVASEAAILAKLAAERRDDKDAKDKCRTAFEFQSFLNDADRASLTSECQSPAASMQAN